MVKKMRTVKTDSTTKKFASSRPSYIIKMKPDLQLDWMEGYSLDMLQDVLTVADYTSLYFFLDPCDHGVYDGIKFIYKQAYDRWTSSGF